MTSLFIFTIFYQTFLILVHAAVYAGLVGAFGIESLALKILFIILTFTFVSASLLSRWLKNKVVGWYYAFAAYWFGLVHFLFAGVLAFFVLENVANVFHYYIPPEFLGVVCFGAAFALHSYATWSSNRAQITHVRMAVPEMPAFWRGKSVVFVSDLHLGNVNGARFAQKIAKKIAGIRPEVVFLGGDIYDGVAGDMDALIAPLKILIPPQGFYFISGNHEYHLRDAESAFAAIKNAGIRILDNEKVEIEGLSVIGVDYHSSRHKKDFEKILRDIGVKGPSILLKHSPHDLDVAQKAGITVGFFGHTHRGQIWPLSRLTKRVYKGFDYGFKLLGDMQVYTSSGVGTWGPPLRLGAKSEIVLIEFA